MNEHASSQSSTPDQPGHDMALLKELMTRLDEVAQQLAALSGKAVPAAIGPVDRLATLVTYQETKRALGYGPSEAVA